MIRFNRPYQTSQASIGGLQLLSNFPNPFVEMTMLRFHLPEAAFIVLSIFDAQGRMVTQKEGTFDVGENQLVLQRQDLQEPGIYEYQIATPDAVTERRKLVMF
jgi:hypothetical protein